MPPKRAIKAIPSTPIFADCVFSIAGSFPGQTHGDINALLVTANAGAQVTSTVTKKTTHLITNQEEIDKKTSKVTKAASMDNITLVSLDWITESLDKKKKLDIAPYTLGSAAATSTSSSTNGTTANTDSKTDVDMKAVDSKASKDGKSIPTNPKKRNQKRKAAADSDEEGDHVDKKIKTLKAKVTNSSGTAQIRQPPVDRACTLPATYSVYVDSEVAWNARLNQTNIGANNNKFYFIQLLRSTNQYAVFCHWGRVGSNGQSSTDMFFDLESAKREFDRKFRGKTKNSWSGRDNFVKHPGKYHLLPPDDGDSDDEDEDGAKAKKTKKEEKEEKPVPESKLHPKVQELMGLIFNTSMMNRQMKELDYDADKMPLGKLAKATILHGYEVLKKISVALNAKKPNESELSELSSEFYTVIPHNFGFAIPPIIKDAQTLKKKLEMLEALGEIEIAQKLMKENKKAEEALTMNPLDQQFISLKLNKLEPMDKESERYKLIEQYVKNTHGSTHYTKLAIDEVFDLSRQGEDERFDESGFSKLHNRRLLWHGSRLTNYVGILSQGLRIAPPEAPVSGYMFDKGAYFADCVSKSANYCFVDSRTNNTGLMLLCEVALGDMYELEQSDYNAKANSQKAGKQSTKGLGLAYPDEKHDVFIEDNLLVPVGPLKRKKAGTGLYCLQYNEYIVYNTSQIKMRYLIRMKFGHGY
ncbi:poly polymerase catalytic domain-domain-containing protein [Lobosporangium transversale]|uniref:Poly [ADP-ribose] polymerase n=1 Tax=Lobosporangium transversale TaxID=64571 RepID=A0A1Y2GLK4_9FUNG|nr:poly polymerase catalytic domain-domain-containing protein [Lobosporangium transversale]ORZ14844.1 poly polymerase catalytic domain-domain-containing protein [Lobosporangium transversale]|eukprot:XP_021880976.1 poly polymerase catalytic domain-domain-containing protein [Lobosporangium transversale]